MDLGFGKALEGLANAITGPAKALANKPVRDMTPDEALLHFYYLMTTGEIVPTEKIASSNPGKVAIQTSMAGVDYLQANEKNGGRFGSIHPRRTPTFKATPAFSIVLYRLAQRLKSTWGASTIVWGGVGIPSGVYAEDCHGNGNCIDFYGATTARAGVFDVRRDWFFRPVYRADGTKPRLLDNEQDRWGADMQTYFRLSNSKGLDPEERDLNDANYYNPRAKDFFADVYTFVSEQCAFGPSDTQPGAFKSGNPLMGGYTMHPDYPSAKRRGHNDHMHFQLGQAVLRA